MAEPGILGRTVQLGSGPATVGEYANEVLMDHTIHAWDLAVAIGDDPALDPVLVDHVQEWIPHHLERLRSMGGLGDPVEPPADASDQDRLLALLGRQR